MPQPRPSGASAAESKSGAELITLAQKLARDAERHALLSASLATQADRLMMAGLRLLDGRVHPDRGTSD